MKQYGKFFAFLLPVLLVCILALYTKPHLEAGLQLKNLLTTSYDLEDLDSYLIPKNYSRNRYGEQPINILSYGELNEKFPIEVTRYPKDAELYPYSVYRVDQGGYYYVFWTYGSATDNAEICDIETIPRDTEHMYPIFSTYIHEGQKQSAFDGVEIGITTAADILKTDPYAEYDSLSCGHFTFHVLQNHRILRVQYKQDADFVQQPSFDHLYVTDISVVDRQYALFLSCIWESDFPV